MDLYISAPLGAHVRSDGVAYRVWAPEHQAMRVLIRRKNGEALLSLHPVANGYFEVLDPEGKAGDRYLFEVAGSWLPDPASRSQPDGVEEASQVVAPRAFTWTANRWIRPAPQGRTIYELHVGAFTPEGTFRAASKQLEHLVELGVNTIELMPLGDFPGRWNWGYDGVMPFAPARCYGTPDDLRMLIDAAHRHGLALVVDVVYNHIGPVGNVLPVFSAGYFHQSKENTWGQGFEFRNPAVRDYFIQNACMWLDEYRVDGLRIDAVHAIEDPSPRHLVAEIAAIAHQRGAWTIAEDERNEANLITPRTAGGWGVDAVWSDDFHHSVRVALTGEQQAYYRSFTGSLDEWVETFAQGWYYDGKFAPHLGAPRGTPAGHLDPHRFIACISNHDQVGNRPLGDRLHEHVSAAAYRATSMLLCLVPYTPMLFMGQEWAATTRFPYFTDLPGSAGAERRAGRIEEFEQMGAQYDHETLKQMPEPQDPSTFAATKLKWEERDLPPHQQVLALYRECLHLRARETDFQNPPRRAWTVARVGSNLLAFRWLGREGDWLLLIGVEPGEAEVAGVEPIRTNSPGQSWTLVISSNELRFGGAMPNASSTITPSPKRISLPGAILMREYDTLR